MSSRSLLVAVRRPLSLVILALPLVAAWCPDKIDAPAPVVDAPPIADPGPSTVNVALAVPLASVRALAEQAVRPSDGAAAYNVSLNGGADNCGAGVSLGYGVSRGPITISASGSAITTSTGLSYWVKARAKPKLVFNVCGPLVNGSCGDGEPLRTASISLTTDLAVDPTWRLTSSTHPNTPNAGNRCTVTFLNFDVTDHVLSALNAAMGSAAHQLDAEVSRAADLRSRMDQVWSALSDPIQVAPSVWLVARPASAGVTPLSGNNDELRAGAQLVARPTIVLGDKPSATHSPLPNMTPAPGGNSFNLQVPVDAPYAAIGQQIDSIFQLKTGGVRYPATGKYFVKPTGVQLYGYGTKAVVRLAFDGSAKGVIYLIGTPSYDPIRNVLTVPDLDYTLETKNLLLKLTNWTESERLRADLRSRLTLKVDKQVAVVRATAASALNRKVGPLTLTGRVDDLRILGVYAQPDSGRFRMLTTAAGTLNVAMQ